MSNLRGLSHCSCEGRVLRVATIGGQAMRFLIIVKANPEYEAGALLDGARL